MAQVDIPDEVAARLQESSRRSGRSIDQVVLDIVEAHLEEEYSATAEFSGDQIDHFNESLAQIDRGEVITAEEVDRKFEAFFANLAAR